MQPTADRLAPLIAERYALERPLGEGATAEVFLARDRRTGAAVALKVLRESIDDGLAERRFQEEIRLCRQLDHPGIVSIVDAGMVGGSLYYAMELVDGTSLRERLDAEGPLPIDDVLRIGREIAAALAHAHERGVMHRDVKPENIMLERSEGASRARLTDFGVARALDVSRSGRITRSGLAVGTPMYMCPEQAFGEADARSDQYALGCVLYEMLAGEPPFTGSSFIALMARHAQNPVPPIRTVRSTVPEWLEDTVVRTLAKVPADRFPSCDQLAEALAAGATVGGPAASAVMPRSIAVLPLVDATREQNAAYLCDGISEEMISVLSRVSGLRVLSRASSFTMRGQEHDLHETGRRLGVTALLSGSLRTAGDRLRVNVALSSTREGVQLWSDHFDGTMDDVFAFEDQIARGVAGALELHLPAASHAHGHQPTRIDAAAHDAYLRGRHLRARRTHESLAKAAAASLEAVAREPDYALAHASLALVYATQGVYGSDAPSEVMPLARASAERALSLDPRLGEALAALGCVQSVYDRDFATAEETFVRAASVDPGNPTVHHWLAAQLLIPLGRFDEAHVALRRARALDPLSTAIGVTIGLAYLSSGALVDALEVFAQVRALDPHFAMEPYFSGLCHTEAHRYAEASAALERATTLSGRSAESVAALAQARAAAGNQEGARELLSELRALRTQRYVSPALFAQIHAMLGEHDLAFQHLDEALEVRSADLIWVARRGAYAPLRADARWSGVLTRIYGSVPS